MTVVIGQKTTEILQTNDGGAQTIFAFFGESLPAVYANIGYADGRGGRWPTIVRTALDSDGYLWIGFDYLQLWVTSLVGTYFPMIWACNKTWFSYDPYATSNYHQFINGSFGIDDPSRNPSYPSGDYEDWRLPSNLCSSTLPEGTDINMASYNMYRAGKLEDVAVFVQEETSQGTVTKGYTWLAGTYIPDQAVTDPQWASAQYIQLVGIEEWLDYYPWARHTGNNSTWWSHNRANGSLKRYNSGWKDVKNQTGGTSGKGKRHNGTSWIVSPITGRTS